MIIIIIIIIINQSTSFLIAFWYFVKKSNKPYLAGYIDYKKVTKSDSGVKETNSYSWKWTISRWHFVEPSRNAYWSLFPVPKNLSLG